MERLIHHFGKLTQKFNNFPRSDENDRSNFRAKTIIFLWEVSQIFFLLPFLAFRSDGGKKVKRQSMDSFHISYRIIRPKFYLCEVMKFYRPIVYPSLCILSFDQIFFWLITYVSYVNRRIAIYHEHAVLFFHFDRKWLGIFLSKVSRQKTRGWYRANYSHFHRNKNWNSFVHSYILLSRSEFSFHLPS